MSTSDSLISRRKIRRDGWTAERQLRFLEALDRTRSVTKAACASGMSRESAIGSATAQGMHLFAAAWDKALRPRNEGHNVVGRARRLRLLRSAISRANPPKVTKLAKFLSPGIDRFENALRDLLYGTSTVSRASGSGSG